MKVKTKQVLAKNEHEFTTEFVFKSGGDFFYGRQNGGWNGAYQPRDQINGDWGFWHNGPTQITRSAALAKCAEFGVDEVDI